jgi:membrane fusion protein (multidrug efflux system)
LNVDTGSEIKQGQVIAGLSHSTLDAQLQQARAKLAGLTAAAKPNELKAKAQVDAARALLNQLLNPSSLDLQVAQSVVATAQSNLDSKRTKLDRLQNPTAAEVAAAQEAVAHAQTGLGTAQGKTNQAIAKETTSLWQSLLQHRIALQANQATLDNPALSWELTPEEIADAEEAVVANQEQISIRLKQLISFSLDPDDIRNTSALIPEEIRIGFWTEVEALEALETAKAQLRELQNPSQDTIAQVRYEVDAAQASLDAAIARLDLLKTPRPAELAAAKTAVAVAEQTLALTEEAYVSHDIQAAQAQVNQIEAQLAELQVRAPFDGFVTQVWLSPGEVASPQAPIVTVASRAVLVSSRVEETVISSLQKGQRVTFISPALPGQDLELQIQWIAPTGDEKAHTFSVQMSPTDADADLKPGMSGEVLFSTQRENVVLVPQEAVLRQGGQPALFVVQDGKAHLRQVVVGLTDQKHMEVLRGVQPGDRVVVSGQNLLNEATPVTILSE